jgi:hypothetical protein
VTDDPLVGLVAEVLAVVGGDDDGRLPVGDRLDPVDEVEELPVEVVDGGPVEPSVARPVGLLGELLVGMVGRRPVVGYVVERPIVPAGVRQFL